MIEGEFRKEALAVCTTWPRPGASLDHGLWQAGRSQWQWFKAPEGRCESQGVPQEGSPREGAPPEQSQDSAPEQQTQTQRSSCGWWVPRRAPCSLGEDRSAAVDPVSFYYFGNAYTPLTSPYVGLRAATCPAKLLTNGATTGCGTRARAQPCCDFARA